MARQLGPITLIARLKAQILANNFRRSPWMTIGFVIGALYALSLVAGAIALAILGSGWNLALTTNTLVVAGSIAILAWLIGPIVAFGVDTTIDPHRFALFPLTRHQLLSGMALAGLIGIPGIATALAFVGVTFTWWRTPQVLLVGLIGAVGGLALAIVGSRALTAWLAPQLERRGIRELVTVLLIVPLMLSGTIISWVAERAAALGASGENPWIHTFRIATTVLGWTPFGAPWAMPAAALAGDWLGVLLRLLILAAGIGALWALWSYAVRKALERPTEVRTATSRVKGVGLFGHLPATPTGAVAARAATYWRRDPRYMTGLLVIPLMPVVMLLPMTAAEAQAAAEIWPMALAIPPLTAWILAFSVSNDIGYDYTAFALHLTTGVSGRADRWGRLIPMLALGLFISIAYSILAVAFIHRWELLPPVLGATLGVLGATAGVSAAASAKFIYPVAKPGESPLKQAQGQGIGTVISQMITMAISVAIALPGLGLAVWAVIANNLLVGWLTLLIAPAIGVLALIMGVRLGARWYEESGPELLQKVANFA